MFGLFVQMRLINGQPIDVVAGRRSARRPGGISAPGAEGWWGATREVSQNPKQWKYEEESKFELA